MMEVTTRRLAQVGLMVGGQGARQIATRAAMKLGQMLWVAGFGSISDENRAEFQARLATLGQLRPEVNFFPVAREWIYGAGPVTELVRAAGAWAR